MSSAPESMKELDELIDVAMILHSAPGDVVRATAGSPVGEWDFRYELKKCADGRIEVCCYDEVDPPKVLFFEPTV